MATYCTSEKPIFIGHYYKPKDSCRKPEAQNIYCLDFQAAGEVSWSGKIGQVAKSK